MYKTQKFREALTGILGTAVTGTGKTGFNIFYAVDSTDSTRFVVFSTRDIESLDGRNQIELEVNTVGPLSDADSVELVSDAISEALDHHFEIQADLAFYTFRQTRNRLDGSDPHTVRIRATYDLYLYER